MKIKSGKNYTSIYELLNKKWAHTKEIWVITCSFKEIPRILFLLLESFNNWFNISKVEHLPPTTKNPSYAPVKPPTHPRPSPACLRDRHIDSMTQ